ncbi:MAG: hypothetical protein ACKOTB_00845, partial [Planctomycetia bacterium]
MGAGVLQTGLGIAGEYGRQTGGERSRPRAHAHDVIADVVFAEVASLSPAAATMGRGDERSLADCGIDASRFIDLVNRLEGRDQMRFREEWLRGIRTCGDLVACIATRMFDEADRAGDSVDTAATVRGAAASGLAAETWPFPESIALEERLAGLEAAGLENPFLRANEAVR